MPEHFFVEHSCQVSMKTKQDIKRDYKERKVSSGVFQVKNTANGKIMLGSTLNPDGPLNRQKLTPMWGKHPIEALQKDWNEFGADKFVFEILEVVKVKDDPNFNLTDE